MSIFNDVFDIIVAYHDVSLSLDYLEKIHRNINIYLKAKT